MYSHDFAMINTWVHIYNLLLATGFDWIKLLTNGIRCNLRAYSCFIIQWQIRLISDKSIVQIFQITKDISIKTIFAQE